ncbi:MAG TPA: NAD(P)/FAD-dependent oxidoreductase [Myxococcales bacterium]|nr:NAD(P)/FAD-dependent oxidoreductase [Myxococcales bacterium]
MMESADVAVIGAGVIGLGVARALARAGREVVVLESERQVGMHTSSRNSEVIHAGIYYPKGSLKAQFCVEGRQALYAYCAERGIAHARPGKLIVATNEEEIATLGKLRAAAEANGVMDLVVLTQAEVHDLEPDVSCVRGIFSPSTGLIDSHALMAALKRDAEAAGAQVALGSPVRSGRVTDSGIELVAGDEAVAVRFRLVVNCAGPWAQEVAHRIEGVPAAAIPPQHFAKGHYFVMPGQHRFRHLVYPVPVPGGLGTHLTLDLAGQARFGPDVQWCEGVDYAFDESRAASFYASIRRYYPGLPDGALVPGFTGVRPKTAPAGSPAPDFQIDGPAQHGVPGLVNLFGIESPGLTSVLAIADHVRRLVEGAS